MASQHICAVPSAEEEGKSRKRKVLSEEERALEKIAKDEANEDLHQAVSKYLLSRTVGHTGPRLSVYELCKAHTKVSRTTMNRRIRELRIGQDEILTKQDVQEKLKLIEIERPVGRRPDLDAEALMVLQETAQVIDLTEPDHSKKQALEEAMFLARKTHAQNRGDHYRAANMKEFCSKKFRQYTRLIAPEISFPRAPRSFGGSSSSSSSAANNNNTTSADSSSSNYGTNNASTYAMSSSSSSHSHSNENSNTKKTRVSKSISGTTSGTITRVSATINTTTIGTQTLSKAPTGSAKHTSKRQSSIKLK